MLKVFLVFSCLTALAASAYITGNTQPGCKTAEELNVRTYRDNWDPTAYWVCETRGQAATQQRCPSGMAYMQSLRDCVPWAHWQWEAPVAPPSQPDEEPEAPEVPEVSAVPAVDEPQAVEEEEPASAASRRA